MRKFSMVVMSLFLVVGLTCAPLLAAAEEKLVLRFAHVHPEDPENSEIHFQALKMKELLADKGIEVKIFPASQLGNQRDIEEQMRLGTVDLNNGGTATFTRLAEKLAIVDLAYLWRDFEHLRKVLEGEVGELLRQELLPSDLRILAYSASWGWRNIGTKDTKVTSREDLKGLKIRTIEAPIYVGSIKAMGAVATPLSFGEIYTALQTNIIDGYEHTPAVSHAYKFDEVIKYYTLTEHMLGPLITVISEKAWAKMTDEQRQYVTEAAIEAARMSDEVAPMKEKENLEAMKAMGVEIVEIDKQPFFDALQSFNKKFAQDLGMEDVYEMILATE